MAARNASGRFFGPAKQKRQCSIILVAVPDHHRRPHQRGAINPWCDSRGARVIRWRCAPHTADDGSGIPLGMHVYECFSFFGVVCLGKTIAKTKRYNDKKRTRLVWIFCNHCVYVYHKKKCVRTLSINWCRKIFYIYRKKIQFLYILVCSCKTSWTLWTTDYRKLYISIIRDSKDTKKLNQTNNLNNYRARPTETNGERIGDKQKTNPNKRGWNRFFLRTAHDTRSESDRV